MKKIFYIVFCLLLTGCAVYPTSYRGYNPDPIVVYPSHHNYWHEYGRGHHNYWHEYGRGHHHMRHW